jgi:hypothetical protein
VRTAHSVLLAHWDHSERRIARYQMLCRVGRRAERAFVFARPPPRPNRNPKNQGVTLALVLTVSCGGC